MLSQWSQPVCKPTFADCTPGHPECNKKYRNIGYFSRQLLLICAPQVSCPTSRVAYIQHNGTDLPTKYHLRGSIILGGLVIFVNYSLKSAESLWFTQLEICILAWPILNWEWAPPTHKGQETCICNKVGGETHFRILIIYWWEGNFSVNNKCFFSSDLSRIFKDYTPQRSNHLK